MPRQKSVKFTYCKLCPKCCCKTSRYLPLKHIEENPGMGPATSQVPKKCTVGGFHGRHLDTRLWTFGPSDLRTFGRLLHARQSLAGWQPAHDLLQRFPLKDFPWTAALRFHASLESRLLTLTEKCGVRGEKRARRIAHERLAERHMCQSCTKASVELFIAYATHHDMCRCMAPARASLGRWALPSLHGAVPDSAIALPQLQVVPRGGVF